MNSETVQHVPAIGRDRNGDPVGAAPAPKDIFGAIVWPRASSEFASGDVGVGGENIKIDDNAYNRTISFKDALRIRGEVHEITEPPQVYAGKAIMIKTKVVRV